MSHRATGVLFIVVAALLYATRYIAAAIFGSGVSSWNSELFQAMLSYVGDGPAFWALLALIVGVAYLIWAEYAGWLERRRR
jgi:hypothetical protein